MGEHTNSLLVRELKAVLWDIMDQYGADDPPKWRSRYIRVHTLARARAVLAAIAKAEGKEPA